MWIPEDGEWYDAEWQSASLGLSREKKTPFVQVWWLVTSHDGDHQKIVTSKFFITEGTLPYLQENLKKIGLGGKVPSELEEITKDDLIAARVKIVCEDYEGKTYIRVDGVSAPGTGKAVGREEITPKKLAGLDSFFKTAPAPKAPAKPTKPAKPAKVPAKPARREEPEEPEIDDDEGPPF